MITNLCSYLDRAAEHYADRIAVMGPDGARLTYRELHDLSTRVAGYLVARGLEPGDRVGVIAPKGNAIVAILYGIMRASGVYVPADYTAPAPRNRLVLSDCAVKVAFLDPGCAAIMDEWPGGTPPVVVWMTSDAVAPPAGGIAWNTVANHAPLDGERLTAADGVAYILYTSGSTGIPKGVVLTHGNAICYVDWCAREFAATADDQFSSHAPFHFDLSILDLYVPASRGATLHLISEATGKAPQELASFIVERRLTVWYSTPSILALLAQFGALDKHDCSSLRIVCFAGEVFPVKHLRNIVARWPQAAFYNLYGPTETNVCTYARIPAVIPAERIEPYPIGHVCDYCESLVLDEPAGREVERGGEGLLHIAGASLFQGYWGRPQSETFFERDGRRWYNTGDVVREDGAHGFIYLGRRDRMVKRRGYRIELGEIERGLYQESRVREAAVVALPDPAAGVRIVAYVAPHPGEKPSIIELKTFCNRGLPTYMNADVFVVLDALPRTSTDKVDYQELIRRQHAPKV